MSFIQQKHKFNIDHIEKKVKKITGLFPTNIRCLICGPSGAGKTNVIYNLIVKKQGIKFSNLYIISKSLDQEKYKNLIEIFKICNDEVKLHTLSDCDNLTPQDVEKYSTIVFDDINSPNITQFFAMGRHRNLNLFYLCQSYSKVHKHLRDNVNFLILFKQDDLNLKHIYNNHVGNDFTFKGFRNLCHQCWDEKKYGFLVIDKERAKNHGKYRFMFDQFYNDQSPLY